MALSLHGFVGQPSGAGERALSPRSGAGREAGPAAVCDFRDTLVAAGGECRACRYLSRCDGYFKWPNTDYDCTWVKELFGDLAAAAGALRADLADQARGQD
ncbi:MAG: hypothetical protein EOM91_13310 [Sphingobacteriia bacterium]|nr:hypothetical protein [Sphingobacteriia bacterium]NCC40890.1 hypothetical protein [Gammaproteobacteria bacterium]